MKSENADNTPESLSIKRGSDIDIPYIKILWAWATGAFVLYHWGGDGNSEWVWTFIGIAGYTIFDFLDSHRDGDRYGASELLTSILGGVAMVFIGAVLWLFVGGFMYSIFPEAD